MKEIKVYQSNKVIRDKVYVMYLRHVAELEYIEDWLELLEIDKIALIAYLAKIAETR